MVDPLVPALREAASHRGYRLLVSKKRTPGIGDFGKFGLADAKGKPILGVGVDGLTASAQEVEAYLRGNELDTWKQSAKLPAAANKRAVREDRAAANPPRKNAAPKLTLAPKVRKAKAIATEPAKANPRPRPKPKPSPEPPPLRIRKAAVGDSEAIAKLLAPARRKAGAKAEIAARMTAFAQSGSGLLVAEKGKLIGCLAWTLIPALHRPPSGRIATLIVAEAERRRGVGRALVDGAVRAIANIGGASVEVMSDIEFKSAHGFFRRLGFEETSYRFAKPIATRA